PGARSRARTPIPRPSPTGSRRCPRSNWSTTHARSRPSMASSATPSGASVCARAMIEASSWPSIARPEPRASTGSATNSSFEMRASGGTATRPKMRSRTSAWSWSSPTADRLALESLPANARKARQDVGEQLRLADQRQLPAAKQLGGRHAQHPQLQDRVEAAVEHQVGRPRRVLAKVDVAGIAAQLKAPLDFTLVDPELEREPGPVGRPTVAALAGDQRPAEIEAVAWIGPGRQLVRA